MKKCPYCAEEIQNEAIYCRYCHRDLVEKPIVTEEKAVAEKQLANPAKKPRNPFLISCGMGVFGATATWLVKSQQQPINFNDLILSTISSFILWGLITSCFIWIWRVAIKQPKGIEPLGGNSGCYSAVTYMALFIIFVVLVFANSPGMADRLAEDRRTIATQQVLQNSPVIPTGERKLPTETPVQASWQFRGRMEQLVSSGFMESMNGKYYQLQDYTDNFAKNNWFRTYRKDISPKNFIIRAETSWESASNNLNPAASGCGFIFHEQQEDALYGVFLGMDGIARLYRMGSPETEKHWEKFYQKLNIPADSAELLLAVNNGRIIFLVNGVSVIDVIDYTIPDGSLGLMVHSGTDESFGIRCTMKNIELVELP